MVATLLATVFVGAALTQGPAGDGDGINDRYEANEFVDKDGDGVNDRALSNPEFVDEDGDGICDTHGVAPGQSFSHGRQGAGRGRRSAGN